MRIFTATLGRFSIALSILFIISCTESSADGDTVPPLATKPSIEKSSRIERGGFMELPATKTEALLVMLEWMEMHDITARYGIR